MNGCDGKNPMRRMTVARTDTGTVRLRFEFCCAKHSPAPWIETEHTPAGALRMAKDIETAVYGLGARKSS